MDFVVKSTQVAGDLKKEKTWRTVPMEGCRKQYRPAASANAIVSSLTAGDVDPSIRYVDVIGIGCDRGCR